MTTPPLDPETWARLHEMWERMLRLSDDALKASRQQDADVFWRTVERQQEILRDALILKAARTRRRR